MNTRLLKKIKKRYAYFWHNGQLLAWDKLRNEEVQTYVCTQYWMIRTACGFFKAEQYLSRRVNR